MNLFDRSQQREPVPLDNASFPKVEKRDPIEFIVQRDDASLLSIDVPGNGQSHLLLAHGAGHTHHTFDELSPRIAEHYKTFAYDIRGHGQSSRNKNSQYTHRQFVDDMAAVIDSRGAQPTTIVASSVSALHALQLAAERPALVSSLVMIDILPIVSERVINGLRKFFQMSNFGSFEELIDKYGWLNPSCSRENMASELQYATVETTPGQWNFNFDRTIIDIVGIQFMKEFQEYTPFVHCPILLISGGLSKVVPPDAVTEFRRTLPRETTFDYKVVPNAHHCPWRENPEMVFQSIMKFAATRDN